MAKGEVLTAAERIEKKYGGKWKKAGSELLKPPPSIPTGSLLLDEAIGDCKGYPEGSIIEAFGPQHSGKTLMGYLAIAASQRAHSNRDHLIIDAENQFRFQSRWAKVVGVDVENLYVSPVTSAEECFDKIEMAILGDVILDSDGNIKEVVKPGNFGVILIDSVTQLTPLEIIHKAMDESKRMASLASVMSVGLKKVVSAMSLVQSRTILFFVNQTRANPSQMFGNPEVRTGGNSLPFYNTIAFRVSKVFDSNERDEAGKIFAHQVKLKFDKNKAGQMPADPIVFRLRYDGTGIDNDFELFSVAKINKIIAKVKAVKPDKKGKPGKGGKYNFIKPGTEVDKDGVIDGNVDEAILDKSIENFKEGQFKDILTRFPDKKTALLDFVKKGSFYSKDDEIEEEKVVDEEGISAAKEKHEKAEPEEKKEETKTVSSSEVKEKLDGPKEPEEPQGIGIGSSLKEDTEDVEEERPRRRRKRRE